MGSEPTTIQRVSIENFRGFRRLQTIDLGASAIVVSGTNGKGKTSFFDALQWLLLGSVSRLANLASRRSGEYLVNRFARPGAEAAVTADLLLEGGRLVTVKRTGNHKRAVLEWTEDTGTLNGEEAEAALCAALLGNSEVALRDTVMTSGILEQDVVRAVLEDEPKNRYRHMTMLLGLEDVAGFQDETKRQADELNKLARTARDAHSVADQRLRAGEAELERLEQRLAGEPQVAEITSQLLERLRTSAPAVALQTLPTAAADAVALGQQARRMRTGVDRLVSDDASLREQEQSLRRDDPAELAALAENEAQALADHSAAEAVLVAAREAKTGAERRASDIAELAARAIPLLGEHCPVCGQTIDAAQVTDHLQEVIAASGEDLPTLTQAVSEAEERLAAAAAALDRVRVSRSLLEREQRLRAATLAARGQWRDECVALASQEGLFVPSVLKAVGAGDIQAMTSLRTSADQLASVSDQLAALLSATSLTEEVERQRDLVRTLRESVAEAADQASEASRRAADATTLAEASIRAVAGVTKDRFASLQPLVNDIFSRLAPHPAFTALGFDMTVAYRSGVADPFVRDPETDVTGDPLLVFSSSQTNVAALTYFLALSWAADQRALPFLLLDDPLQSMDDVNALGFADLCRHLRQRRQLIVSTHEARLAGLLERKLAPRSAEVHTRVVRFTGWDRGGPTIDQADLEAESVAYLLKAS